MYGNYYHSYPYNTDRNTTGYSGCIMPTKSGERVSIFNDAVDSRDLVRASIESIINTDRGERVMLPNFGGMLKDLLFEPLDEFLLADIKENLINTLNAQEPRIYVKNIEIQIDYNTSTINLSIDFQFLDGYKNDTFDFTIQY